MSAVWWIDRSTVCLVSHTLFNCKTLSINRSVRPFVMSIAHYFDLGLYEAPCPYPTDQLLELWIYEVDLVFFWNMSMVPKGGRDRSAVPVFPNEENFFVLPLSHQQLSSFGANLVELGKGIWIPDLELDDRWEEILSSFIPKVHQDIGGVSSQRRSRF